MRGGILPVYKPTGITTYDVIRVFKRSGKFDGKIGHGGTLDPFAEGVVLLLLGRETTRTFSEIQTWKKGYMATAILGGATDTLDREGKLVDQGGERDIKPSAGEIKEVFRHFLGLVEQNVPAYSAAKHMGAPMYKLARRGIAVPKKVKPVEITSLVLREYRYPKVVFETEVSSGTYVRQLSYDIFEKFGIPSYLDALIRTSVGNYSIQQCCRIENLDDGSWVKWLGQ